MSKVGQVAAANNGQKMTIVVYRNNKDIDVRFEDGTIVCHKSYAHFQQGSIRNPNKKGHSRKTVVGRVGEVKIANNGQKMTIIAYRFAGDIDVQFEDGTVVTNKQYQNFKKGEVRNSNCPTVKKSSLYKVFTLNNGQKATIIKYNSCDDLDVQLDDGTIICNKSITELKKGRFKNPTYLEDLRNKHVGEISVATNGQIMKIVAYHRSSNIDILFEDGTLVRNKSYPNFKRGYIANPNKRVSAAAWTTGRIKDKTGEMSVAKNGQKMIIVAYRNNKDIDVQFEDGTVVTNKCYHNFKKGSIQYPN